MTQVEEAWGKWGGERVCRSQIVGKVPYDNVLVYELLDTKSFACAQ